MPRPGAQLSDSASTQRDARDHGRGEQAVKVVLFSYHYFESRVRAGFHHLAEAYWELGWDVTFVTAPVSWLSYVARDRRLSYPLRSEAKDLKRVRDRLQSYVLFTLVHPANLRVAALNRMSGRALVTAYRRARLGPLAQVLRDADLVVFESTPAILLAPTVRELAPHAHLAYRVSDDLGVLRAHPAVVAAERELLPVFDLVSVITTDNERRLGRYREVARHPQALDRRPFDEETTSPYGSGVHACWVGNWRIDDTFLELAASRLPDWTFHVIGRLRPAAERANVAWYGELDYGETVPFVKHADVGLAAYSWPVKNIPGYLAESSLKITQYAYCGLPIVAPSTMRGERPHVFYYEPDDGPSIEGALRAAKAAGRNRELGQGIPSWLELAEALATRPVRPSRPG